MRSLYLIVIFVLSLGFSVTVLAQTTALENCQNAWKQSSAYESCKHGDMNTAITASGTHCNIETICLDQCTWPKEAEMNWITVNEMKGLQNCDGQLAHSSSQCKVDNEERCYGDTN